jgi:hypothetical protein
MKECGSAPNDEQKWLVGEWRHVRHVFQGFFFSGSTGMARLWAGIKDESIYIKLQTGRSRSPKHDR